MDRWLRLAAQRSRRQNEQPSTPEECARAFEASRYAEHSLSDAAAREFEQHLAECAECGEVVASFAAGLVARDQPATPAPSLQTFSQLRRRRMARLLLGGGMLAAASLLGVALYQGLFARGVRFPVQTEVRYVGVMRGADARDLPAGFQITLACDRDAYVCGFLWYADAPHPTALLNGYRCTSRESAVLPSAGSKFPLREDGDKPRLYLLFTARPIDADAFTSWVTSLVQLPAAQVRSRTEQFAREHDAELVEPPWPPLH
jgi:hypothetical protein